VRLLGSSVTSENYGDPKQERDELFQISRSHAEANRVTLNGQKLQEYKLPVGGDAAPTSATTGNSMSSCSIVAPNIDVPDHLLAYTVISNEIRRRVKERHSVPRRAGSCSD
jgi:hypothetical protein